MRTTQGGALSVVWRISVRTTHKVLVRIARKLSKLEPQGSIAKLFERGGNPRKIHPCPVLRKDSERGLFCFGVFLTTVVVLTTSIGY